MHEALLKQTEYRFDSGGKPAEIPKLSYEEFIDFHKDFYHPSNSNFISYGQINTKDVMESIDTQYLANLDYKKYQQSEQIQE